MDTDISVWFDTTSLKDAVSAEEVKQNEMRG